MRRVFTLKGKSSPAFVSSGDGGYRLEKNREAFLREVAIMSEHICDVALTHRHHRDAVRQAVAFVASSLVQIKTTQERLSRLVQHRNTRVLHCFFEHSHNNAALSVEGDISKMPAISSIVNPPK